jgi:uncharacterized NAD(P)/FAD-binding protein YdhS
MDFARDDIQMPPPLPFHPGFDPVDPLPSVVIIGGGFAGTVTAIKLLDAATDPLSITIVEKRLELGRGLAYSSRDPAHVMNGPAKLFSLYPERPEHFARFLARYGRDWGWRDPQAPDYLNAYAPRWIYGDYLRAELARALAHAASGVTLQHIAAEADDLRSDGHTIVVTLQDGRELRADQAVLALGVFQGRPDIAIDPALRASGSYVENPWYSEPLETLKRNSRVLLIGSGLTMLDVVISLERRGHRGTYLAVSRRGFGVHPRRDASALRDFLAEKPLPRTVLDLLRTARAEFANTPNSRPDWQSLVMAIRPHVGALWQQASLEERRRFLRHLRPIWETSLHRAPPQSTQLLERGRTEGWFAHRAGRLQSLQSSGNGRIAVEINWRGDIKMSTVSVDTVINCTGPQHIWPLVKDRPLVTNLLARGLVRPGPLSFGIDADLRGSVIGRDGRQLEMLSALGPALRGVRWESSTINEVLQQAIALADRLLIKLQSRHAARAEIAFTS